MIGSCSRREKSEMDFLLGLGSPCVQAAYQDYVHRKSTTVEDWMHVIMPRLLGLG